MVEEGSFNFVDQGKSDMTLVLEILTSCPKGSIVLHDVPRGEDRFDGYVLLGPKLRHMTEVLMQGSPCVEVLSSQDSVAKLLEVEEGCLDS